MAACCTFRCTHSKAPRTIKQVLRAVKRAPCAWCRRPPALRPRHPAAAVPALPTHPRPHLHQSAPPNWTRIGRTACDLKERQRQQIQSVQPSAEAARWQPEHQQNAYIMVTLSDQGCSLPSWPSSSWLLVASSSGCAAKYVSFHCLFWSGDSLDHSDTASCSASKHSRVRLVCQHVMTGLLSSNAPC